MNTDEFAALFRNAKDELLGIYTSVESGSAVASKIAHLGLTSDQNEKLQSVLDEVLTDAFYTVLMGLGGASSLGEVQQGYTIIEQSGHVICKANDGELEASAWDAFQSDGN